MYKNITFKKFFLNALILFLYNLNIPRSDPPAKEIKHLNEFDLT
jgi:hypothetical protein